MMFERSGIVPSGSLRDLGVSIAMGIVLAAGCQHTPGGTLSHAAAEKSMDSQAMDVSAEAREVAYRLERISSEQLPNPVRIHPKVISGGLPKDTVAFAELQLLGIKTIISVDGARPDVELARQFGMRYIHLPHGYDGVSDNRALELAKAVLVQDGPIYIHCHHGKHRSPTAAAIACVGAGLIRPEESLEVLKFADTSPSYVGLYQSASRARRYDSHQLLSLPVHFQEVADVAPFTESMVELDHLFTRVSQWKENNWQAVGASARATASHDVLMLREYYRELLRTEGAVKERTEFREWIIASERATGELEVFLQALLETGGLPEPVQVELMNDALARVEQNCKKCHLLFRDQPQLR
jgi:protein tyrosine phosphatase (PTP) superfamily phosphohydrolase (DUF442 family)